MHIFIEGLNIKFYDYVSNWQFHYDNFYTFYWQLSLPCSLYFYILNLEDKTASLSCCIMVSAVLAAPKILLSTAESPSDMYLKDIEAAVAALLLGLLPADSCASGS